MDERNSGKLIRVLGEIADNLSGIKDELKKIRENQERRDEGKDR